MWSAARDGRSGACKSKSPTLTAPPPPAQPPKGTTREERQENGRDCGVVDPDEVRISETRKLIDTVFDGSASNLVAALVSHGDMSSDDIAKLRQMIDEME